jgi:hypothetical protein
VARQSTTKFVLYDSLAEPEFPSILYTEDGKGCLKLVESSALAKTTQAITGTMKI